MEEASQKDDEGFLSKVLRNQRSLSLDNLIRILEKIGYEIEFKKKEKARV